MRKIVVYGAGHNVYEAIGRIKTEGNEVIALCDTDPMKWGGEICGIKIENYHDVRERETDFYVYISPNTPIKEEIQEYLLHNALIDENRILNLSDGNRYISCGSLERVAIVTSAGINMCCNLPGIRNCSPYVAWKKNVAETVKDFVQYREEIIDAIQGGGR